MVLYVSESGFTLYSGDTDSRRIEPELVDGLAGHFKEKFFKNSRI